MDISHTWNIFHPHGSFYELSKCIYQGKIYHTFYNVMPEKKLKSNLSNNIRNCVNCWEFHTLSEVCNFCICNRKSVFRPHVVGHNSHWNTGLSPVWIRRWAFKLLDWVNRAWQMSHSYGFSPVCIRKWRFNLNVSGLA